MNELYLFAPAKINLGLEVIRRRDDGYHDINTIFAALDLCDEIILRSRNDSEIRCIVEGNDALRSQSDDDNLCVKAALAAREYLNETQGLDIHLHKRIPMGAGLGGGSSDAATVLKGIPEIWGREINENDLMAIAASLGSDVPFFLHGGGVAHANSRGEDIHELFLALPWHCLLVDPGIHVSTACAYKEVNRTTVRSQSNLVNLLHQALRDPQILCRKMVNDFELPIFATWPEIGNVKKGLYHYGAFFAQMSGSGSTLYGLFENREQAEEAQEGIAGLFPTYRSMISLFRPVAMLRGHHY